jgi:hypothetical protein
MSSGVDISPGDRQALSEFERYLVDEIAPLMVVDAVQAMLHMPPEYGAAVIERWLQGQLSTPGRAADVPGYLYHAIKKIHLISEFKLIDPQALHLYLDKLSRLVVRLCPEKDQAALRLRLSRIGENGPAMSVPIHLLHRDAAAQVDSPPIRRLSQEQDPVFPHTAGAGPAPSRPASAVVEMLTRRLENSRRAPARKAGAGAAGEEADELVASLISRAAIDSRDPMQFESALDRVRQLGLKLELDQVFRQLGKRVPGWRTDLPPEEGKARPSTSSLLRAMQGIVSLAGTSEEGAERFSDMIYAGIEQLNDGYLPQAVAVFDAAQQLIDEKKVDAQLAVIARSHAQRSVSLITLRKLAASPDKHELVRRVLNFFEGFSPQNLIERLESEQKRDIRKLILSLLEVHGPPCRPVLLARLAKYQSGELADSNSFFSRNLVFLLRRIPRAPGEKPEAEIELLAAYSQGDKPFLVTKEAVGALGQLHMPRAARALIDTLTAFELKAISGAGSYTNEETMEILDRTCEALGRVGTSDAVQAVVSHGFRGEPQLGNNLERLRYLGSSDLCQNGQQLRQLLRRLRKALPTRILGFTFGGKPYDVGCLIEALAGTPSGEVLEAFQEIVERFPRQEIAERASDAIARHRSRLKPESKTAQPLSGELEPFDLPDLLRSLADAGLTGRLVLSGPGGQQRAVIRLHQQKIQGCETGQLCGLDAICQLFERPLPGSFRFERTSSAEAVSGDGQDLEVIPTILEAMVRYDEFQQDLALVPDGSSPAPGKTKPSLPEREKDTQFAQKVWREAVQGRAPESCEGVLGDAYRVRRLYAHWVEKGSLVLRPSA